jgi:CO/xanthine dehydrogenase FAD-binding subunit
MIPFSFSYLRPETLDEAITAHARLAVEGKSPFYYAGGSEIISMCRVSAIRPGAVIDVKRVPELMQMALTGDDLVIGAACTLREIASAGHFPLLSLAGGRIADHTNQCRITLGGNLCGTIRYRETSLPLLLSDARIALAGPKGTREVPMREVFDGRMKLKQGELVVRVRVPRRALDARHFHIKKTRNDKIDYPLVSVSAMVLDKRLRVACSGVCPQPFRGFAMEDPLNDRTLEIEQRVERACASLPEPALSDVEGSAEYRVFVLKNTLREILEELEQ